MNDGGSGSGPARRPAGYDIGNGAQKLKMHSLHVQAVAMLLAVSACSNEPAPATGDTPKPTRHYDAPYAIGNRTIFIHDESRPYDSVNGIDEGIRTLITEIWYPVDHAAADSGQYERATYGDYVFGDRAVHRLMMMQTTFFHLTPDTVREGVTDAQIEAGIEELFNRERGSFVDAPLAGTGEPFPVVVFSPWRCRQPLQHGDGRRIPGRAWLRRHCARTHRKFALLADRPGPRFRDRSRFRCKKWRMYMPHLSALGAYGEEANFGQAYTPLSSGRGSLEFLVQLDKSLLQRLNDLRAALRELDRMNTQGFAGAGAG